MKSQQRQQVVSRTPTRPTPLPRNHQVSRLIVCSLVIHALRCSADAVVVHQVRFIENKTGRTDYALTGETIELSCHYMMKDELEDVKQVIWSKDGENFLRWLKFGPGLEVLSYAWKGHFDPTSKFSHLIINNVTIGMHGKYKCQIRTDLGTHETESDLIVVSQGGCKLGDWRVLSEQPKCQELFKLDCRNMFPRPVTSCGLWNNKLDKFIRAVTVDISEEPNKETYRVRYSDKFDLGAGAAGNSSAAAVAKKRPPTAGLDLLAYAGHLSFRCDIIVPETSWRLSLAHRMFDYSDGCNEDPLASIERLRLNFSHYATARMQQAGLLGDRRQPDDVEMLTGSSSLSYELMASPRSKSKRVELNCWQKPRVGTLARLSCANNKNVKLTGATLLECRPGGWVPLDEKKSGLLTASKPAGARKTPRKHRSNGNQTAPKDLNVMVSAAQQRQREELTSQTPLGQSNDLTHHNDNDDDDNSMPTNDIDQSTTTTIPTTTTNSPAPEEEPSALYGADNLTPDQLAALLPRCVSTSSRGRVRPQPHRHGDTRLAPSDEAVVLGSYSQRDKANHLGDERRPSSRYRNEDDAWQWFTFFSSSSCSQTKLVGSLTLVVCLFVATLLAENCRPMLLLSVGR